MNTRTHAYIPSAAESTVACRDGRGGGTREERFPAFSLLTVPGSEDDEVRVLMGEKRGGDWASG